MEGLLERLESTGEVVSAGQRVAKLLTSLPAESEGAVIASRTVRSEDLGWETAVARLQAESDTHTRLVPRSSSKKKGSGLTAKGRKFKRMF